MPWSGMRGTSSAVKQVSLSPLWPLIIRKPFVQALRTGCWLRRGWLPLGLTAGMMRRIAFS